MCGRYALKAPASELAARFGLDEIVDVAPRYNISPGTEIPTIRHSPEGKRVMHLLRWGLVPHWAKDPGVGARLSYARGETVAEKPSFRDAFNRRPPGSGGWLLRMENRGPPEAAVLLQPEIRRTLCAGCVWESWRAPNGDVLRTCCLITTWPNEIMLPVHDRMPVIISPDGYAAWLTGEANDALDLVRSYPADEMQAWAVSKRVSRSGEEGADLIRPDGGEYSD